MPSRAKLGFHVGGFSDQRHFSQNWRRRPWLVISDTTRLEPIIQRKRFGNVEKIRDEKEVG